MTSCIKKVCLLLIYCLLEMFLFPFSECSKQPVKISNEKKIKKKLKTKSLKISMEYRVESREAWECLFPQIKETIVH